jgi:acetyltransferase-like isoleucine patch superfamily enzyme
MDLRKLGMLARRFLVPRRYTTVHAFLRWRATVSTHAEVELGRGLSLGRGTTISSFCKFKVTDGPLTVGENGGFATGCHVATGPGGIAIGKNFICGPNTVIVANNYGYADPHVPVAEQPETSVGIRIGDNVWIGSNCTILDGSVIGDNSIVVANSLVNRRFEPSVIIQGNPAKVLIRRR